MSLNDFVIEYGVANILISVRIGSITYSKLSVTELLKCKEIMDKEISLVEVQNNIMVIYL